MLHIAEQLLRQLQPTWLCHLPASARKSLPQSKTSKQQSGFLVISHHINPIGIKLTKLNPVTQKLPGIGPTKSTRKMVRTKHDAGQHSCNLLAIARHRHSRNATATAPYSRYHAFQLLGPQRGDVPSSRIVRYLQCSLYAYTSADVSMFLTEQKTRLTKNDLQ